MPAHAATDDARTHARLAPLLALTGLPTAAGREHAVLAWIDRWLAQRPDLASLRDEAGNLLLLTRRGAGRAPGEPLVLFTAHLDHPAFVVEQLLGDPDAPGAVALTFRGGVMDAYFKPGATRLTVHGAGGRVGATLQEFGPAAPLRRCVADLDDVPASHAVRPGDVATWDLPVPSIREGVLHAPACDDLAGAAAALAALDELRAEPDARPVGVLLTRAEEVGFIGAIAACKHGFIPDAARVIALENSRAFAESPVGGGMIVRVGDRAWTFSPELTGAVARVCEDLAAARASGPTPFRWQRKLMPGGTCEATCFGAYGHEATCLCLPLGNYHNMGALDAVQAGDHAAARIEPEFVAVDDYLGLVDCLTACGRSLGAAESLTARMERLYEERSFVLREGGLSP